MGFEKVCTGRYRGLGISNRTVEVTVEGAIHNMTFHGTKGTLAPPQSVPHMRDIAGTRDGSDLPVLGQ